MTRRFPGPSYASAAAGLVQQSSFSRWPQRPKALSRPSRFRRFYNRGFILAIFHNCSLTNNLNLTQECPKPGIQNHYPNKYADNAQLLRCFFLLQKNFSAANRSPACLPDSVATARSFCGYTEGISFLSGIGIFMNHRDRENHLFFLTDAQFIIFALQIFVHPFLRKDGRNCFSPACSCVSITLPGAS